MKLLERATSVEIAGDLRLTQISCLIEHPLFRSKLESPLSRLDRLSQLIAHAVSPPHALLISLFLGSKLKPLLSSVLPFGTHFLQSILPY